jgi:hypothetical protein
MFIALKKLQDQKKTVVEEKKKMDAQVQEIQQVQKQKAVQLDQIDNQIEAFMRQLRGIEGCLEMTTDGIRSVKQAWNTPKSVAVYKSDCYPEVRTTAAEVAKCPDLSSLHGSWKTMASVAPEKLAKPADMKNHILHLESLIFSTKKLLPS